MKVLCNNLTFSRHCEERSDVAIHKTCNMDCFVPRNDVLRFMDCFVPRNDVNISRLMK
jgi:hypothetical protein